VVSNGSKAAWSSRRAVNHAGQRKKKIFFSLVDPAWQPHSEKVSGLGSRWAGLLGFGILGYGLSHSSILYVSVSIIFWFSILVSNLNFNLFAGFEFWVSSSTNTWYSITTCCVL
jgi:hypothetical protein